MTALEKLFNPSTVAVIGASRTPGKVGYAILSNIVSSGFNGEVYPVNPNATEILGLKCYPRVTDVPSDVDIAIISIPAQTVLDVAEECGRKGVEYLVVISAGFKEVGPEGLVREVKLQRICRRYGMRLLGPNCLGFIDTYTPLNASFAAAQPLRGYIAFVSQSGALATSILNWARSVGVGFSRFVTLGNRTDIDESDVMESLRMDPNTKVILLYLESVSDGEKFRKIARMVSTVKPVIVVKAGASQHGAVAASLHTGSIAGSDSAYEAVFKQCGVIRARSLEELFHAARLFTSQPIPEGYSTVIVTNAGGPGILATDACERYGVELKNIPIELARELRAKLPPAASLHNPIDILGDADAERYRITIESILAKGDVDALLIILTPQAMSQPRETAEVLAELRARYPDKVMLASFIGGDEMSEARAILRKSGIVDFDFPDDAASSLSILFGYKRSIERLSSISEARKLEDVDREFVETLLSRFKLERKVNLLGYEAFQILSAYNIPTVPCRLARIPEEAIDAAEDIGYPVVVKVSSPEILHKTDVGGVKLNLNSPREVADAFEEVVSNARRYMPRANIYGVEVSKMAARGVEVIVGMHRDPQFGPLMMFGLGGIYVDFLRDVSFRVAPLSAEEALEMIRETKAYTLLRGVRGGSPSDIESLVDVIVRVAWLSAEFREIADMDLNPIFVYEKGKSCIAVDAKITLSV
ncbi:MAG: acetate--CoA ligase family protein [Candidatus Bathyarchaeia archaeon]